MTEKQALKILKTYQKWRRGADIKMLEPLTIGQAIDTIIKQLEDAQQPLQSKSTTN